MTSLTQCSPFMELILLGALRSSRCDPSSDRLVGGDHGNFSIFIGCESGAMFSFKLAHDHERSCRNENGDE
jgi:hypothetical protein